jgi:hypothetical protein
MVVSSRDSPLDPTPVVEVGFVLGVAFSNEASPQTDQQELSVDLGEAS